MESAAPKSNMKKNTPLRTNVSPLVVAVALVSAFSVQAQFTEVDISGQVNADIQQYTDGFNYQLGGTTLNVAGVPFGLAEVAGNPETTGVVQSPYTSFIAGADNGSSGFFDYTFSVPAGTHATTLYSLANLAFGQWNASLDGSIVVTGTDGETATLNLYDGVNIRDHNNGGYSDTLSDPTVVSTYFENGAPTTDGYIQTRLDMQQMALPSDFAGDTIASIDFEGYAQGFGGSALLAGLTLGNSVPDAACTLVLLGATVGGLVGLRRKLA